MALYLYRMKWSSYAFLHVLVLTSADMEKQVYNSVTILFVWECANES